MRQATAAFSSREAPYKSMGKKHVRQSREPAMQKIAGGEICGYMSRSGAIIYESFIGEV
jgi:hypothetical protein